MRKSGSIHRNVLDELAPRFIVQGVSEAELAVNLYAEMLRRGSHGVARFNLPLGEDVVGLASFGKSGLVKTALTAPAVQAALVSLYSRSALLFVSCRLGV